MNLLYKTRWQLADGTIKESDHNSEKGALNKARDRSKVYGLANCAGFSPAGKIATSVWTFEDGKLAKKDDSQMGEGIKKTAEPEGPEDVLPSGAPVSACSEPEEAQEEASKAPAKGKKKTSPATTSNHDKETKMATKKTAKTEETKTKAKAPKKSAGAAARHDEGLRIAQELKCREGTVRHRLAVALGESFGEPVAESDLLMACYETDSTENKTALGMVLKGIKVMIEKEGLAYEVTRSKIEGLSHITLAFK